MLGAVVAAVVIGACGTTTPAGPSVGDFAPGSCRQVAREILDISGVTRAVAKKQTSAGAAEDPLTADQSQLMAVVGGLSDRSLQARVRTLIADIGFLRFTVDHHTFDGSQNIQLARDAGGVESACASSRPIGS